MGESKHHTFQEQLVINSNPRLGRFVPPEHYSASGNNKTRVNEAKLVDSMIPLSSIMVTQLQSPAR